MTILLIFSEIKADKREYYVKKEFKQILVRQELQTFRVFFLQ